jgi:hypothetical protein
MLNVHYLQYSYLLYYSDNINIILALKKNYELCHDEWLIQGMNKGQG